ncbi:MAG: hypothetical protein RJA11_909 [Bacteroidota bacterium]
MRIELIPDDIRCLVKEKLETVIDYYELSKQNVINVRRSDQVSNVIADVILDYYQFICNYQVPDNAEQLRYELVNFIKAFESIRKNSILDYAPDYEKFLRHYGY